jgi:DNA modification methylase
MEINTIYNEDCFSTIDKMTDNFIDLVVTSPPYNISRVGDKDPYDSRYDVFEDGKTNEEYIQWSVDLFNKLDRILKPNSSIVYNISYSSENVDTVWFVIADIIRNTNFTTADCIVWKKSNAIPNNVSKNKLTRIVEFVFIFCRKEELHTFYMNKKVVSQSKTKQNFYENIFNFIEAKNNDGSNNLNKATYSTELVLKLLNLYCNPDGALVYDPFMGTGTTANACLDYGVDYIGSELSPAQVEFANKRLSKKIISKKSGLF